jgi:putative toxin-antitoxin system antitoxin component (TIGR02293 family)
MQQSEKSVAIERITALAERVFGNREKATAWLNKPKQQFNGKSPMQMVDTEDGERLVEKALIRIDEGMFA